MIGVSLGNVKEFMNLKELLDKIPEDLKFAVLAGEHDPDLASGCPALVAAIEADRKRKTIWPEQVTDWDEEIQAWIQAQLFVQEMAEQVSVELEESFPVDLMGDSLPGWLTEWWAPVLLNPWADRLDAAVISARKWIDAQ